jgi:ketosteroid isomerase-like protein
VSQENVEIVRALLPGPDVDLVPLFRDDEMWAAANPVIARLLHPEFECANVMFGTTHTYVGLDGLRAMMLDWMAAWATYRLEVQEAIDCGDRVLVLTHDFGSREASGREVKLIGAEVWTVRDGKIARWEVYADRADAVKTLGLEE